MFYEMSEPQSEIGVSIWGPGQALATAYKTTTSSVNVSVSMHGSKKIHALFAIIVKVKSSP